MATTIQISDELKEVLSKQKIHDKETYEEVIWDLVEDRMELSEETKKALVRAEEDIKAGRTVTLAELKKKYGIK